MLTATKPKAKLSEAELSILYDRIYDIAERLFKKHNPCNIRIKGNKVLCACKVHSKYRQSSLCCQKISGSHCKYWLNGCTVKCLPCKLFICPALYHNKQLNNKLHRLRRIAEKYGMSNSAYFHTKSEVLNISRRG